MDLFSLDGMRAAVANVMTLLPWEPGAMQRETAVVIEGCSIVATCGPHRYARTASDYAGAPLEERQRAALAAMLCDAVRDVVRGWPTVPPSPTTGTGPA